jgi:hypothetical protein
VDGVDGVPVGDDWSKRTGCGTTAVGGDSAVASPAGFAAVTRTANRSPASALATTYPFAVASSMGLQASGSRAAQRSHSYRSPGVGVPVAVASAVSFSPTTARPAIVTLLTCGG